MPIAQKAIFIIDGTQRPNDFIDLRSAGISGHLKVVDDKGETPNNTICTAVQSNWVNNLFDRLYMEIDNQPIETIDNYEIVTYLKTCLNSTMISRNTFLLDGGILFDDAE